MLKNKSHLAVSDSEPKRDRDLSPVGGMSQSEAIELKDRSNSTPLLLDDVIETSRFGSKTPNQRDGQTGSADEITKGRDSAERPQSNRAKSRKSRAQSRAAESKLDENNSGTPDMPDLTGRPKDGKISAAGSDNDGSKSVEPRQISVMSLNEGDTPTGSRKRPRTKGGKRTPLEDGAASDSRGNSRAGSSRGSASSSLGSVASNHDDDMDFFCADHMQLVTNKVLREEHTTCQHIVPVEEWAEAQRMERDRQATETLLKKIDMYAGLMVDDRMQMKTELTESKESVLDEFLDMVEDLVTELLKKQKDFTQKLEEIHDSNIKTIDNQIKRCTMIQRETSSCLTELETCAANSEKFKVIKRKVQEKCPIYEEILRRDFNASIRLDYEFIPNEHAENVFKDFKTLGEIVIKPTPSKLPAFMSMSAVADFGQRAIGNAEWIEGRCSRDERVCCFSGCAYLPNGRVVVTDWNNGCVKMFNPTGLMVSRLTLPNNPWDVKMMDDSNLVVTVPGEKKLFLVEFTKEELKGVAAIDTDCECWGVAPFEDKFAVTCDPWSKSPSVKIFKNTGKLSAFFQKDVRGEMLFKYPEHITTDSTHKALYVSDSRANKVIGLSLSGQVLFKYGHEKMISPAGLVTDSQGNIYVCGKDSHNVHQISKSGALIQILMADDDVECPRSISFEPSGESIVLTDTSPKYCDELMLARFK